TRRSSDLRPDVFDHSCKDLTFFLCSARPQKIAGYDCLFCHNTKKINRAFNPAGCSDNDPPSTIRYGAQIVFRISAGNHVETNIGSLTVCNFMDSVYKVFSFVVDTLGTKEPCILNFSVCTGGRYWASSHGFYHLDRHRSDTA